MQLSIPKQNLSINGTGTLTINALYNNGINCRDDLKLINGTYIINSVDDGIVGHDSVTVAGGTFTINSKGDAIKSSKSDNDSEGYIHITGGEFTIIAAMTVFTPKPICI